MLVPPILAQRFDMPRPGRGNTTFAVDYSLSPTATSRLDFDHRGWREFDDVDWGDVSTLQTNVSGSGRVATTFRLHDNFFTNTFTFSGEGRWHNINYLDEEAEEFTHGSPSEEEIARRIAARREREYRQTGFSTTYNMVTSLRPFHRHRVFGASNVQHTIAGRAVRSEFETTVAELAAGEDPSWRLRYGAWNRDEITSHQLSATAAASIRDRSQTVTFTAHVPPRIEEYTVNGVFNVWITTTTANWGVRFPEGRGAEQRPFNVTHTMNFRNFGSFSQMVRVDTEDREVTQLNSTLNVTRWGISLAFRAARIHGWEFVPDGLWGSWVERREEEPRLQPQDFTARLGRAFERRPRMAAVDSLTLRADSATTFDLQRYDNSRFTFGLTATAQTRLTRLSLSAESENNAIFRYFRNWPMFRDFPIDLPEGRQNNLFLDLFDSFNFADEEARRRSGFKIRRLVVDLQRSFGDWNASLNWQMAPHRLPGENWEMGNRVSFLVQWVPIPEFRTEIFYDQTRAERWRSEGL